MMVPPNFKHVVAPLPGHVVGLCTAGLGLEDPDLEVEAYDIKILSFITSLMSGIIV
jgi:hypothetical protein